MGIGQLEDSVMRGIGVLYERHFSNGEKSRDIEEIVGKTTQDIVNTLVIRGKDEWVLDSKFGKQIHIILSVNDRNMIDIVASVMHQSAGIEDALKTECISACNQFRKTVLDYLDGRVLM